MDHLYTYYLAYNVKTLKAEIDGHRYAHSPFALDCTKGTAQIIEQPRSVLRIDESLVRGDTAYVKLGAVGAALVPNDHQLPGMVILVPPIDASIVKRVGRFNVRLVQQGERYGLNDCLVCESEPKVEFYWLSEDHDHRVDGRGQFVSRYYLKTLMDHPRNMGLNLDGGVTEWSIDAAAFCEAIDACARHLCIDVGHGSGVCA